MSGVFSRYSRLRTFVYLLGNCPGLSAGRSSLQDLRLPGVAEPEPAKVADVSSWPLTPAGAGEASVVVLAGFGRRRRSRSSLHAFGGSLANWG